MEKYFADDQRRLYDGKLKEGSCWKVDVSFLLNPTARTDLSKIRTFEEPSSMIVIDTPDSVFSSIFGQKYNI